MTHLLSVSELAKRLGIAPRTIYNRRHRGDDLPPAIRCGGNIRFDPADVEVWLNKNKESARDVLDCARPSTELRRRGRGRPTKAETIERQRLNKPIH